MPVRLRSCRPTGAAYGLFPIAWIVFASIMLYRLAVDTGKFAIIKDSVGGLTSDRRLQALFIAFSFGAFIEGAAGFGAPVAVSGAMLVGLGFSPFYAAGICLIANTAPVAFGSIGIPVTTLAGITGLPLLPLSAMVGRLCALISIIIPVYLVVVMAGWRKTLDVLPAVVVCGVSFAAVLLTVSNVVGPELADILSSLSCIACMVLVLKFWKPRTTFHLAGEQPAVAAPHRHSAGSVVAAWSPYLLLVVFVLVWGYVPVKRGIDQFTNGLMPSFLPRNATALNGLNVPGLHNLIMRVPPVTNGPAPYAAVYAFNWLSASGTACFLATVAAAACLRVGPRRLAGIYRPFRGCQIDADDRIHACAGVPDELLGDDLDAWYRPRDDGPRVSVLQRDAGLAGRLPDRERHVLECAVRQFAGHHGESDRAQSGARRIGQCRGRRHGQDDFAREHRRRLRCDRPRLRGRSAALPLHLQTQHLPGLPRRHRGDAVRLRVARVRAGAAAEKVSQHFVVGTALANGNPATVGRSLTGDTRTRWAV
jgi:hypothetical protein